MANLPQNNQSLAPDYMAAEYDTWCSERDYAIQPGQTLYLPPDPQILAMPPVYGAGVRRVRTDFFFVASGAFKEGNVIFYIGVRNPSEFVAPQRPGTGINYAVNVPARVGHNHCARWDVVVMAPGTGPQPVDSRSWTMNPGQTSKQGRAGYPSLLPLIENHSAGVVTVNNVQIFSELHR